MTKQNPNKIERRSAVSPEVYLSDTAAKMYARYCEEGVPEDEAQVASAIRNFLVVTLPVEYQNKQYALCGNLAMIFRRDLGPVRIAWIWRLDDASIEVIYIEKSPSQSQGDVFSRVAAGEFDHLLQAFGAKPPLRMASERLQ
jgi:hypothetical protein